MVKSPKSAKTSLPVSTPNTAGASNHDRPETAISASHAWFRRALSQREASVFLMLVLVAGYLSFSSNYFLEPRNLLNIGRGDDRSAGSGSVSSGIR